MLDIRKLNARGSNLIRYQVCITTDPVPTTAFQPYQLRRASGLTGVIWISGNQGCARLMSRESNLTRLWLKWVESELSRPWKSGIWVESESNHADRHLSQSWINWTLLESKLSHWFFWRENVKILHLSVTLPGKKQPTTTFNRTPPPFPGQQPLAKLDKMWWVVSQIWLNSDSNELSQVSKFGIWV